MKAWVVQEYNQTILGSFHYPRFVEKYVGNTPMGKTKLIDILHN